MPSPSCIFWKSVWRSLGIVSGILILLYLAVLGYHTHAENDCREDGKQIVAWIEAERTRTGHLPGHIARPSRFHQHYRIEGSGGEYYIHAYFFARISLDHRSEAKEWIVNRDN